MESDFKLDDKVLNSKKMIVSDLDGTLAKSKSDLAPEMSRSISELLKYKQFAVIGGGSYVQFSKQFISHLKCPRELLPKLHLFPTCATVSYEFERGAWREIYSEVLAWSEKIRIISAFNAALKESGFIKPKVIYGDLIEDRRTQVTFSAFGQKAPLEVKKDWDLNGEKRKLIVANMVKLIPEFEVRIGGTSSIDVTRKGIDKAYGIRKILKKFNYAKKDLLFVGDALFEGGNDYPVKREGIDCVSVCGPDEASLLFSKIVGAARNARPPNQH